MIVESVRDGFLSEGDTLIMDNASVHGSLDTIEPLVVFLEYLKISIMFLPAYSPEFNPCELIFAQVKKYLRDHRDMELPLHIDIAFGFAQISQTNMLNYYNKCCRKN